MSRIIVSIVDSRPFVRAGVREALERGDRLDALQLIECDPGPDGSEVIARLSAASPDVVMLDIGYPFLHGLQLAKKILKVLPQIRVLVLSTNPEEDDDELFEVIKTGAAAYLRSGQCSPPDLVQAIRRVAIGDYPVNDCVTGRPTLAWRVLKQFQEMASTTRKEDEIAAPLTQREVEILGEVAGGNSNKRIATTLGVSEQTIKNHVSSILRKLHANDRAHAVMLAVRCGLVPLNPDDSGDRRRGRMPSGLPVHTGEYRGLPSRRIPAASVAGR